MHYYKWILTEHCIVLLILVSSMITWTPQNEAKFHLYSPLFLCCYSYRLQDVWWLVLWYNWKNFKWVFMQSDRNLKTHRPALRTSQSSSEAVLGQYFPYSLILYSLHLSECIMINILLIFCCSCCEIGILINIFLIHLNHWILYTVFKRKFLLFKSKQVFGGGEGWFCYLLLFILNL